MLLKFFSVLPSDVLALLDIYWFPGGTNGVVGLGDGQVRLGVLSLCGPLLEQMEEDFVAQHPHWNMLRQFHQQARNIYQKVQLQLQESKRNCLRIWQSKTAVSWNDKFIAALISTGHTARSVIRARF